MIIILWAFGIFLLQSRYDFGPQAETRSTAEQKGHPLPPTVGLGAPARNIDHQRVTRECQRRVRGAPWSTGLGAARRRHRKNLGVTGPEDPRPNPRLCRPGSICTRSTVVGAIRQAVRPR